MKTKFQEKCELEGLDAVFKDGVLIHPIPRVRFGGRERKEMEFIQKAISKYSFSSVVEAMYNKKIILTL